MGHFPPGQLCISSLSSFLFFFGGGRVPLFQRWTEARLGWGYVCPEVLPRLPGTLHPSAWLGAPAVKPSASEAVRVRGHVLGSPSLVGFPGFPGPSLRFPSLPVSTNVSPLGPRPARVLPSRPALRVSAPQQAQGPPLKSLQIGKRTGEPALVMAWGR